MNERFDLSGKTILVTGASGFIGGRLIEYLLDLSVNVRALVRSYGRAVRLARKPVELVEGDVLDADSVRKASEGCDIIFHCAAGMEGTDESRYRTSAEGTKNVLEAAVENNISRFVHISTIAVQGPDPGQVVDENTPLKHMNDVYADSKIDAENFVNLFASEKGLPVVILRPTIVYGPRSGSWTVGPIDNIKKGKLTLIEGGSGIANHVYVDDVVQAMLLAAVCPEAVGETFIISHGTGVTWKEFFGYYSGMLGIELPNITRKQIDEHRAQTKKLSNPFYMGLTFAASPHARHVARQLPGIGSIYKLGVKLVPDRTKHSILEQAAQLRELRIKRPRYPDEQTVEFYTAKGICKIDKAVKMLGYLPQFSLDEGMQLTEAWLRYSKII